MTFVLHRAERADVLADALADLLADAARRSLRARGRRGALTGVERWLAHRLAARLGAVAGSGRRRVRQPRSSRSRAAWSATRWPPPPASIRRPIRGGPSGWCGRCSTSSTPTSTSRGSTCWPATSAAGTTSPTPRRQATAGFAAVRHLADLFDRYAVHRPAMVRAWAAGDDDGRRRRRRCPTTRLAGRAVAARSVGASARPARPSALVAGCDALVADPTVVDLPDRLFLFGLTRLPGQLPRRAAARWPCTATCTCSRCTRRRRRGRSGRRTTPTRPCATRCCGRGGATAARCSWCSAGAWPARRGAGDVHHPLPERATPRRRCSTACRTPSATTRRRPTADDRPLLDGDDRSVQVHACHGRTRQAEVVRDAITHLLADDPTLEPRDIVVMCPDIDEIAPLLRAAFDDDARAAGPHDPVPPGRPLAAPDQPRARRASPSCSPWSTPASPPRRCWPSPRSPPGARAASASTTTTSSASPAGSRRTGTRWGLDAAHRAPYDLAAVDTGTWDAGLHRLLLGVAMSEDDQRLVGGVLPLDDVDSGDIDLAGRFAELIGRLGEAVRVAHRPAPGRRLDRRRIDAAADLLFATRPATRGSAPSSTASSPTVAGRGGRQRDGPPLRLAEIRDLLADRLRGQPTRAAFRTGDLTMCTLVPDALGAAPGGVPRRPRRRRLPPRRCARRRRPAARAAATLGDHDRRAEDRQLLLDAVLAAGDALVITYAGRDPRTNEVLPPAVPVNELLDVDRRHRRAPRRRPTGAATPIVHAPPAAAGRPPLLRRPARSAPVGPWGFDPRLLAGAERGRRPAPAAAVRSSPSRCPPALEPTSSPSTTSSPFVAAPGRGVPAPAPRAQPAALRRPARRRASPSSSTTSGGGASATACSAPCSPAATPTPSAPPNWRAGLLPPGRARAPGAGRGARRGRGDRRRRRARWPTGRARSLDVDVTLADGRQVVGTVPDVIGDVIRPTTFSQLGPKPRLRGVGAAPRGHRRPPRPRADARSLVGSGGSGAGTFAPARRSRRAAAARLDLRRPRRPPRRRPARAAPALLRHVPRATPQARVDGGAETRDAAEAGKCWTSSLRLAPGGPGRRAPARPRRRSAPSTTCSSLARPDRPAGLARRGPGSARPALWDPILDAAAGGAPMTRPPPTPRVSTRPSRRRGHHRARGQRGHGQDPRRRVDRRGRGRRRAVRSTSCWSSRSPARPPGTLRERVWLRLGEAARALAPEAARPADDELVVHLRRGAPAEVAARRAPARSGPSPASTPPPSPPPTASASRCWPASAWPATPSATSSVVEDIGDLVDRRRRRPVRPPLPRRQRRALRPRRRARASPRRWSATPTARSRPVDDNETDRAAPRFAMTLREPHRRPEAPRPAPHLRRPARPARREHQRRRRAARIVVERLRRRFSMADRRRVPGHRHDAVADPAQGVRGRAEPARARRRPQAGHLRLPRRRRVRLPRGHRATPAPAQPADQLAGRPAAARRPRRAARRRRSSATPTSATARCGARPGAAASRRLDGPARSGTADRAHRRARTRAGFELPRQGWAAKAAAAAVHRRRPRRRGRAASLDAGHRRIDGRRRSAPATSPCSPAPTRTPRPCRGALQRVGVPAVVHGGDDVLATEAAGDWLDLLRVLEQPASRPACTPWRSARSSAGTPPRLATAADADWDDARRRAPRLGRGAAAHGVAGLLRSHRGDAASHRPRCSARVGGERQLSDLRHVAELLHDWQSAHPASIAALAALARRPDGATPTRPRRAPAAGSSPTPTPSPSTPSTAPRASSSRSCCCPRCGTRPWTDDDELPVFHDDGRPASDRRRRPRRAPHVPAGARRAERDRPPRSRSPVRPGSGWPACPQTASAMAR